MQLRPAGEKEHQAIGGSGAALSFAAWNTQGYF
jgi:hypothetical protein